MAGNKTLKLSIQIAGQLDKSLTTAIGAAQGQVSSLSRTISQAGTVGLAAMGAFATGTVLALGSCTKEAENFANGMGDVVKYVDGLADASGKINTDKYAEMSKAIRDLSTQIPYTQKELQQLAASAGQSGKKQGDLYQYDSKGLISGFLKDVAIMGTAWDIEAATAGDWAAKWEVALNMTHDEVMTLADQINYLGANNATTAAEIGEVVNKVASFGQVAGMLPQDTAALATSLLAMGVSGDVAASSINRIYTNLNKGSSATKKQKEMWQSMGLTAEGIARGMQENATGTLQTVFEAVRNLPDENRVAALSTLLGQWAIQAGGKLTTNLEAFNKTLDQVQNPNNYAGSMAREFIIKADTPEAVNTMLGSSISAIKGEIGENFLPAKKEMSLALIDLINTMRSDMPQIQQISQSLGSLFANGVRKAGEAMQAALPYIQNGLDYLANNGPQVVAVIKGIAGTFVAIKFAPLLERLFGGAGNLIFGTSPPGGYRKSQGLLGVVNGLWSGGQATPGKVLEAFSKTKEAAAPYLTPLSQDIAMYGKWDTLRTFAGMTANRVFQESKPGRYFGSIKGAWGNLLNTGIGGSIAKAITYPGGLIKDALLGTAREFSGSWIARAGTGAWNAVTGYGGLMKDALLGTAQEFAGSGMGQALGGLAGKAGSAIKTGAGDLWNFGKVGAGLMGSIWGPAAGMFGGLFTGALPIVGGISAVIAVVSILGDHLEDIRGIVGNVFGDSGLAVFDSFTGKLQEVGGFISGLFGEGGVASALAPLRENIIQMFGPEAGAAFDGLTGILQSVMSVVGQVVSFSTGTVKPIIQDIFSFLTGTVMPIVLQTFTDAAPYISGIIDGLGTGIMAGMQTIGAVIQAVLPVVQGFITAFLKIGSVVVPAVLAGVSVFASGIGSLMTSIQGIFTGLINFITGVFTGNWRQAWEGVKGIFGNAFDALVTLCKTPINAVIAVINGVFNKLRGISFTIPEWSPIGGGSEIGFGWLPTLTPLAKGGFTNGPSLAGEAGTEAVISFQRGVRGQNIATWMQAGRMLGLKEIDAPIGRGETGGQIVFAPQITIQGNADRAVIDEALAEAKAEFEAWYEEMVWRHRRTDY